MTEPPSRIRLLNTADGLQPDPECLRDVGFVQRFMARHGLTDAERAAGEEDIESLRSLRGRLSRAWDAANEETAVAELNNYPRWSERPAVAGQDGRRLGVSLRPPRATDPRIRRRTRRARASSRRSRGAAGAVSAGATPDRAGASSSTGRGAGCAGTAAGSAPTERRTRPSGPAALAPNFGFVIASQRLDV